MSADIFHAISDPTRRAIIHMTAQKPMNVNTVSARFDMTRAAVYKHIRVLMECGLINIRKDGRERYCEAVPAQLKEVATWVNQYRKTWEAKLDSLDNYLNTIQQKNKIRKKKK